MEKNPKSTEDKKDKTKEKQQETTLLFSQKEIRNFVLAFVSAWIKGDITIRFPTAAELSKSRPLEITFPSDPSLNAEVKIKEHYIDLLSICAGTKPASTQEQQKAIVEIFRMLLMFRSANRIEGRLQPSGLEERVDKLEKTMKSTNKMLEQITAFLFKVKSEKK
jgi:hypothetical protein